MYGYKCWMRKEKVHCHSQDISMEWNQQIFFRWMIFFTCADQNSFQPQESVSLQWSLAKLATSQIRHTPWDLGMHHWIINLLPAKPVRASIKHASLLALSKMIIKEIVMEGYNTSSKWWIPLEKFGGWIDLATFGNLWFKQLDAFDQLVVAMHVSTMLEQSLGSPISGLVGCACEGLRTSC